MPTINDIADKLAPRIRDAFLRAIDATKGGFPKKALEEALMTGDINAALAVLDSPIFEGALRGQGIDPKATSFQEALRDTFTGGAQNALVQLPKNIAAQTSFDLLNPETVKFLEGYELDLIRQVSTDTKEGLREIIMQAINEGGHPRQQAIKIREIIGLTDRQTQAVNRFEQLLRNVGDEDISLQDLLNRKLRDRRFDATILRGKKLTEKQIQQMRDRYVQRYLKYRAEVIARTESIRAANAGQMELWRQGIQQGTLPQELMVRWIVTPDDRLCPICEPLDGEVVRIGELFSVGIEFPPAHPQCRCTVGLEFTKKLLKFFEERWAA